jgi:hypothetical protein
LQAYADGLLVIPKTLAVNAGYDSQEVIVKLLEEGASGQQVSIRLKIVFIFKKIYYHIRYCGSMKLWYASGSIPVTNGTEQ